MSDGFCNARSSRDGETVVNGVVDILDRVVFFIKQIADLIDD